MKRKQAVWVAVVGANLVCAGRAMASGGDELPFNKVLDTVFNNLTGPTARTLVGIALVLGLCTVMFGRDSEWARPVGKVILGGAAIAGIPTILSLMGVEGAGGPEDWTGMAMMVAGAAGMVGIVAWVMGGEAAEGAGE